MAESDETQSLVVPDKVAIPATLDDLAGQLEGLAKLALASEWARAAIVAAWVEPPGQGARTDLTSTELSKLSPESFAALGFAGLKSHVTVRAYAKAWLDSGYPRPVAGEIVALPWEPFPKQGKGDPDNEWYTPHWLFDALGVDFDMDVCAPVNPEHRTCPATTYLTEREDGLAQEWEGLVWCNPPYSRPDPWVARWLDHGNGVLLAHIPANAWWSVDLSRRAEAAVWLQAIEFHRPNGETQRPGYALQLAGIGAGAEAVRRCGEVSPKAGSVWVRR